MRVVLFVVVFLLVVSCVSAYSVVSVGDGMRVMSVSVFGVERVMLPSIGGWSLYPVERMGRQPVVAVSYPFVFEPGVNESFFMRLYDSLPSMLVRPSFVRVHNVTDCGWPLTNYGFSIDLYLCEYNGYGAWSYPGEERLAYTFYHEVGHWTAGVQGLNVGGYADHERRADALVRVAMPLVGDGYVRRLLECYEGVAT